MTREEAKAKNFDILHFVADNAGLSTFEAIEKAYNMGASEQEPKWIPVSERLPKAGEYIGDVAKYYLVQNEYGDMMVARYTHSEYWEQIYQQKPIGDEIVAWMPLPDPIQGRKEDKE